MNIAKNPMTEKRNINDLDMEDEIPSYSELNRIRIDNINKNTVYRQKSHKISRILELYNNGDEHIANRMVKCNLKNNDAGIELLEIVLIKFNKKFNNLREFCYEKILEIEPKNIVAMEYELEINIQNGYSDKKREIISKIRSIDPDNEKILEIRILEYSQKKNWKRVLELCDIIFKKNILNRVALKKYAEVKYSKGEYEDSSKMYQKLLDNFILNDDEVYSAAKSFYSSKRFLDCTLVLERIAKDNFKLKHKELYIRSLYSNNKQNRCYDECLDFIEDNPDNLIALRYAGQTLINLEKLEMAKSYFSKISELKPSSAMSWIKIIECNMKLGSEKENKILWKKILIKVFSNISYLPLGVEICTKFQWERELEEIINFYSKQISQNNEINGTLAKIFLKSGNITFAYKYIKKSTLNTESLIISNEIERIMSIFEIDISEIERAVEKNKIIWIQELIIRKILKKYKPTRKKNRKKPLVMIITSSLNRGGAEKQVMLTMVEINQSKKYQVKLIVDKIDNKNNGNTFVKDLGASIKKTIQFNDLEGNDNVSKDTIFNGQDNLLNLLPNITKRRVLHIISALKKYEPDIIHAWQDEIIFSSCLATIAVNGCPVLGSARSLNPEEKTNLHMIKRPYLKNCFKYLFENENIFLSTNSIAGKKSYSKWLSIEPNEIKVINNGINYKKMESETNLQEVKERMVKLGIDNNIIIGGIFRLEHVKRPLLWIDCVEKCIESDGTIRGILIGSGKMMDEVKNAIIEKKLEDKIFTVGPVEDVASWLKNIDIFLFTSSSEGLPNSIIEAQTFGVPVISSDVGGLSEIVISGQTGWLIKSDNPNDYSEKIIGIIKSGKINYFKSNAAKNAKRKFSIQRMRKETERTYKAIIKTSNESLKM